MRGRSRAAGLLPAAAGDQDALATRAAACGECPADCRVPGGSSAGGAGDLSRIEVAPAIQPCERASSRIWRDCERRAEGRHRPGATVCHRTEAVAACGE